MKDLEKKASTIQAKKLPLPQNVLKFIGVVLVRNQNIADIYGPASENLKHLRFTDIKFRWVSGANGSKFVHTDDKRFPKGGE